jgi:hypothetical protein
MTSWAKEEPDRTRRKKGSISLKHQRVALYKFEIGNEMYTFT